MSIASSTGAVSSSRKLGLALPVSVWVPLLVLAWVFMNVLLVRVGFWTGYLTTCGLLAGGIDGGVVASVLLATLGDKLQAGTTGLLGGYGFHDALSKFTATQKYFTWIHVHIESIFVVLLGSDENFHNAIQYEVLWMASTAAVVILLTLLVQLIRTNGLRPA